MKIVVDIEPEIPVEEEVDKEARLRRERTRLLSHEMEKWWDKPVPDWTGSRCAELIALELVAPDTWFPGKFRGAKNQDARETAIAICETCPIMEQCREYGLENERHGIWGGVDLDPAMGTEHERQEMNKQGKCSSGHPFDIVRRNGQRWCSLCEKGRAARAARTRKLRTEPEMDRVRQLVRNGTSNAEIALLINVSKRTVERYRKRMIESDEREVA